MVEKILKKTEEITNLYTDEPINYKDYITKVNYYEKDHKVMLEIKPLGNNSEYNHAIQRELIRKLKLDLGLNGVKITYAKRINVEDTVCPNAKVIAVISGKGGVGKSQITYNLAKALKKKGKKVALIDCDIYGYNIQKIADQYEVLKDVNGKVEPLIDENGIEMISTQHFIDNNKNEAVVWRGPMLTKMMRNFFKYVNFSEDTEYLLIDMPPGTGDVMLNLPNYLPEIYTLLVTTPDPNAAHVALRSGKLAQKLGMKSLGIIENMSYLQLAKKHYIFGHKGSEIVADELSDQVILEIPIINQEEENIKSLEEEIKGVADMIEQKFNS